MASVKKPPTAEERWALWRVSNRSIVREIEQAKDIITAHQLKKAGKLH
jgi:hypothetical protein